MRDRQLLWWALTTGYLGATYATLGDMPAYWSRINDALSGHGLLFQYLLYSAVGAALLVFLYGKGFLGRPLHLAVTVVFLAAFAVMFYLETNPGEKIHMLQYGVLGWLVHKSFSFGFPATSRRLYVAAGAVVLAAGAVDEVIQGLLPNRYFTVHDVFVNGLSGIMVQLYICYYTTHRRAVGPASRNTSVPRP